MSIPHTQSGSTQNVYQLHLAFLLSPLTPLSLPLNFVDNHFLTQPLQIN